MFQKQIEAKMNAKLIAEARKKSVDDAKKIDALLKNKKMQESFNRLEEIFSELENMENVPVE